MGLDEEIQRQRAYVRSDGYPMSIGELINLYRDGELRIHPEFQRLYRWSKAQKSRLIESFLLGIPIPSIFVSQREDGVWDVIDGLQRLSTIFELVGILKDDQSNKRPPLTLTKTRYLPSLEGKRWEDEDHPENAIGSSNQLIIKRTKIDVKIIQRESSGETKYELFQRLNTGGSQLSDQEVRNVLLLMVNPEFYRWVRQLATDENFKLCIGLSDNAELQQYDGELAVRFLVFRTQAEGELKNIEDLGDYLDNKAKELAQTTDYDRDHEAAAFRFTFAKLAEKLGDDSLRRFDAAKNRHLGGFLLSVFEVLALGLGYNFERYRGGEAMPDIDAVSRGLWNNEEFKNYSKAGVGASSRISHTVPLGRKLMAP